jgi:hypothetical protein
VLCLVVDFSFSEELNRSDFKVGFIELSCPLDSVIAHLGKAKRIEKMKQEHEGFTAHFYENLTVWVTDDNSKIWAFDFSDSSFATTRGLKVGDAVKRLEQLYGERSWTVKEFSRVGPYDNDFNDYSEATIYQYWRDKNARWYIVFFIKNDKVVKFLLYIGIYE